ncbi:MAG: hypothetical protein CMF51_00395 [Legionellales bacterium]|nr:hypothetical protein [Legionellales bacterium]|tara:strand:- start:1291 stop:1545 length:255 start_codon:yes stop_codon:yes gene_type:complete
MFKSLKAWLSFEKMAVPPLIKFLFYVSILIAVGFSIFKIYHHAFLDAIVQPILFLLVFRIVFEVLIIQFKQYDALKSILSRLDD